MKPVRFLLPIVLLSLSVAVLAQSAGAPAAPSDGQRSFNAMKSLAGNWEGQVTLDPPNPQMGSNGQVVDVTMRITSRGNALVHEMQAAGTPMDPTKYDHPVTMFYLDGGRLTLVHYCDAGNRPRMVARPSPDGNRIEFDFVDLSGGNENGHMYHAVFTIIDANHHTEDWTYLMPGDKPMHAHMDLRRLK
jgi:hypothetical protein